ncbi:MAG: acyltransferase family protein [Intestinibacter sp.]|uniref:acyltransferase family protein n=1 Tax=Intestinibacter sp. TaxID=1965304 RepID=UPI003F14843B
MESAVTSRNKELTILKAIGIIVVVSCHIGTSIFSLINLPIISIGELFPEYSYHMPLFVFTSGYFYKRIYESDIPKLAQKRFTAIKKYINSNLFYFLLCFVLINLGLYEKHIKFTLKSLFVEPFLGGFQFYFNGPAWFVPFLFLLQISYVIIRKAVALKFPSFSNKSDTTLKQESIFLAALIITGFIAVVASELYPVSNNKINALQSFIRILFGLQFFQLGFIYKQFIEKNIKLSLKSFLLVITCKLAILMLFGYYTFSLRIIKFNGHIVLPVVVSVLGIAYCLHLAKFLIKITTQASSKLGAAICTTICTIGDNTWSIMMHHLLVKWSLGKIYDMRFMPDALVPIADYLITPVLCVLLPLLFVLLYRRFINFEFTDLINHNAHSI